MIASEVTCSDIATDDRYVHWVDFVQNGGVYKRASDGGPSIQLATGHPVALTVDDAFVYWLDRPS